jgi:phosphoribosylaminoimidazolecarboxamide formyltransferase/IMP cyclohydrolase
MTKKKITRALVSVYDKTGLVELGKSLDSAGVEILSTGSTASTLRDAGVKVTDGESRLCTRVFTLEYWRIRITLST